MSQLNNYRLDRSHSFKVNFVDDFEKYNQLTLNKEIEGPAAYKNPGNLYWWLMNNDAYDQYCLQHGDMFTSVYLNTSTQPSQLMSREVCSSSIVSISFMIFSI